ncbi:MAG: EamA family transporter [Ruminococcus sp.]|nr:EamA family transporter [Ruminococcus sp.]
MTIKILLFVLLIVMTLMGSVAAFFLKKASGFKNITELIKNYNLYIGAGLYLLSAIINIIVLRYLNYSVVLPLTSITYVWTMVISYLFLKEKVGIKKLLGVSFIIMGCVCIVV